MALPKPTTDRPFSVVSVSSVVLAPVAALSLWLMISDPVTAAAVMERGDLLPVLSALAKVIGKAFVSLLAIL
jgi:hypothetical protein